MSKIYQKTLPAGKNAGFTLIELLVVVLIIGILAAVALPQYEKAVAKARLTEAITALKAITDAQEIYYMAMGQYTDDLSILDISVNTEGKYFNYECPSEDTGTLVRTCYARPQLTDYPTLEFHMLNEGPALYRGKHWCHVQNNPSSAKARALCRAAGKEDTDQNGNYYLLAG